MYVVKPQSSRASSAEAFVIGLSFIENSDLGIMSESISTLKQNISKPMIEESKNENELKTDT